jgi:hypothetical protein
LEQVNGYYQVVMTHLRTLVTQFGFTIVFLHLASQIPKSSWHLSTVSEHHLMSTMSDHLSLGYQLITPTNLKTYGLLERL